MRPAAPKAGKRVFLERVTFLWKRLNFSQKSSVRNLVRYKKRFFMTVFGIGGCTALLLMGFGLKDSVSYLGEGQFEKIFVYDASIGFDAEADVQSEFFDMAASDDRITDSMEMLETAVDVEKDGGENGQKSAYLIVPSDEEKLDSYILLQDRKSGESYELDGSGIIISEKLATLLDVSEGDTVILTEDEKHVEAVVEHITENYFMHYIYMSKELYEKLYGNEPEWNMLFVNTTQTDEAFEAKIQEEYMELDAVQSVTFISGTAETVYDMLDTMNVVIAVLVISAGMLAFIVLYNLNNINISERKRELATLKVLGFFDGEVSAYVNRENIMLTVIGTAVGLLMGVALHRYVMTTVETDTLMFGRVIQAHSYVFSILLTFAFSIIVNGMQYFKLRKIDMVESLKSVE